MNNNGQFEDDLNRYKDDSFFNNQGFVDSGLSYDWMPEHSKFLYNADNDKYAYKDISGTNYQTFARGGFNDENALKKNWQESIPVFSKRWDEYYPHFNAGGRGQSNLSKYSLSNSPFAGTFSGMGTADTYGDYTYDDYILHSRRRGPKGYTTRVKDKDGKYVFSYDSDKHNNFGGALDWIDSQKNNQFKNVTQSVADSAPVETAQAGGQPVQPTQPAQTTQTAQEFQNVNQAVLETTNQTGNTPLKTALTREEIAAQATANGLDPSAVDEFFTKYDSNGDSQVSEEEFSNVSQAMTQTGEPAAQPATGSEIINNAGGAATEAVNAMTEPSSLSLEEVNYGGLPKAEQDLLIETLEDAATAHDWKNMAAVDKFNTLKSYLPSVSNARLSVLAEQIQDAQSAFNILVQSSLIKENEVNMASSDLAQAEQDSNLSRYRNITDTLRGDRLAAERAGEGRGNNFADRLLLQAEMSAADKYEQLQNASNLSDAQRRYESSVTGAGERANFASLLSDSELANNISQVALEEKTSIFQALQDKTNRQEEIADELANVLGSTQERTLPAVKVAELLIEQASQEGKMEIANAEDKKQAIIESAELLLENESLLQMLAGQVGEEALNLSAEFTAEQQDFVNRVKNLKNIPGLVDAIMSRVSEDMFAAYRSMYDELGAIWAIGVRLGLVDADGYVIPQNQFAETTAGDDAFATLNDIDNSGGQDGVDGVVDKGVDMIGDLVGGLFENFGKVE